MQYVTFATIYNFQIIKLFINDNLKGNSLQPTIHPKKCVIVVTTDMAYFTPPVVYSTFRIDVSSNNIFFFKTGKFSGGFAKDSLIRARKMKQYTYRIVM